MTGGAVLDYAQLKPSHLNRWLADCLPDLTSSLQTERNNLPQYFPLFFCFTHIPLFCLTPPGRHRATSWLPLWMFRAQELLEKVIEKVSGSSMLVYFLAFFFVDELCDMFHLCHNSSKGRCRESELKETGKNLYLQRNDEVSTVSTVI